MLFYAVATLPLVQILQGNGQYFQSWYTDDSICAGPLADVCRWLECLSSLGPFYRYFIEPCKSYTHNVHLPSDIFMDWEFLLFLVIGEPENSEMIHRKIDNWIPSVNALTKAAKKSPQVAFAAMAISLQFEWSYLQKVHS